MKTNYSKSTIQPYLCFDGRCDEALDFYKDALGAEVVMLMRFKDNPEPQNAEGCQPPESAEKVMHAQMRIGDSVVMASDGRCGGKPVFEGIFLTLNVATETDADRSFNALADGGEALMPLARTFFSPRFGMVRDRFGVSWMILTPRTN